MRSYGPGRHSLGVLKLRGMFLKLIGMAIIMTRMRGTIGNDEYDGEDEDEQEDEMVCGRRRRLRRRRWWWWWQWDGEQR